MFTNLHGIVFSTHRLEDVKCLKSLSNVAGNIHDENMCEMESEFCSLKKHGVHHVVNLVDGKIDYPKMVEMFNLK